MLSVELYLSLLALFSLQHCRKQIYKSREQFREHINLIVTNCITYNGEQVWHIPSLHTHPPRHLLGMSSEVTRHAQMVADICEQEIAKVETELDQLEAEINPALDDNALVALSYVLGTVVDAMKQVPEVRPIMATCCAQQLFLLHRPGHFTNLCPLRKFQTTTRSSRLQWTCKP